MSMIAQSSFPVIHKVGNSWYFCTTSNGNLLCKYLRVESVSMSIYISSNTKMTTLSTLCNCGKTRLGQETNDPYSVADLHSKILNVRALSWSNFL